MTDEGIKYAAGNLFKESKFAEYRDKYTGKLWYQSCYFSAFTDGIKYYANRLYNKGSIFDIVNSIRETSDMEDWSPLVNFEKTTLTILKDYINKGDSYNELKKKVNVKIEEANRAINKANKELELKDKKIKELEDTLFFLKRSGYGKT